MRRILLAEDNRRIQEVVALTLGTGDFTILQAFDGRQAFDLAVSEHPDLVLLDIEMPEMDGIQVCKLLKADMSTRDIKIIMLTARAAPDDQQTALEAGADDFFSKPFSPIALLNKLYEVFDADGDTNPPE